jgi:hypothetical protein
MNRIVASKFAKNAKYHNIATDEPIRIIIPLKIMNPIFRNPK